MPGVEQALAAVKGEGKPAALRSQVQELVVAAAAVDILVQVVLRSRLCDRLVVAVVGRLAVVARRIVAVVLLHNSAALLVAAVPPHVRVVNFHFVLAAAAAIAVAAVAVAVVAGGAHALLVRLKRAADLREYGKLRTCRSP